MSHKACRSPEPVAFGLGVHNGGEAPVRAPIECQEIPAWEAVWFPEFLAGGH